MNEDKNIKKDEKDVTKEINLDELYDGTVNNTVIIDPISNEEVLVTKKKSNKFLIIVSIFILMALVLYFIIHKTPFSKLNTDVKPDAEKTTTINENNDDKNGSLICTYNSNGDSQNETIKYVATFENDVVINSNFNYNVMSNNDTLTDSLKDLISQYETFYITNSKLDGVSSTFNKNDNGFTFDFNLNYSKTYFDSLIFEDDKLLLFVKPSKSDTKFSLKDAYEQKGYNCVITNITNNESDVSNE